MVTTILPVAAEAPASYVDIKISELASASATSASQEFVELYNPSDNEVDLTGWKLEYKSATGTSWTTKATLAGRVPARGFYLLATSDYLADLVDQTLSSGLANTGGHIQLLALDATSIDLVGWGNANAPETQATSALVGGQSLKRLFNSDGQIKDTNNNLVDFELSDSPEPQSTPGKEEVESEPEPEITPGPESACEEVVITEILPNPAGMDTNAEYIELYNPTDEIIALDNCGLATTANSKIYWFQAGSELSPQAYVAFYNSQTGLTLANAAGGSVFLLSADEVELDNVEYAPELEDDVAWAKFDDDLWQATYTLTPGAANVLQTSKPCPVGEERNVETGQCRQIAVAATLTPCKEGQERNPETNRCRNIATLAPCGPGQERNAATNRCRSITTAATMLKACAADQERNPETNRCRKISAATKPKTTKNSSSSSPTISAPATIPTSPMSATLVAGSAGVALLYGLYEFRYNLRNRLQLLRGYFNHRTHTGP